MVNSDQRALLLSGCGETAQYSGAGAGEVDPDLVWGNHENTEPSHGRLDVSPSSLSRKRSLILNLVIGTPWVRPLPIMIYLPN